MPYCQKCGAEIHEDDAYCPKCRAPQKTPEVRPVQRRRINVRRNDEYEGSLIGGLILIWVGVSFVLRNAGFISWDQFGGVFLLGIGLILFFRGLFEYSRKGDMEEGTGFMIGGAFVAILGAGISFGFQHWWALFLVVLGGFLVLKSLTGRDRF